MRDHQNEIIKDFVFAIKIAMNLISHRIQANTSDLQLFQIINHFRPSNTSELQPFQTIIHFRPSLTTDLQLLQIYTTNTTSPIKWPKWTLKLILQTSSTI